MRIVSIKPVSSCHVLMRADRLISLLLLLRSCERATVNALAQRLDVSPRTVLRDVDALSTLGIPVYAERGRAGGIRLLPGYSADLHALSEPEAEAIALVNAPAVVNGMQLERPLASALQKITAAVPVAHQARAQRARHRLLFDTQPWFHRPALPPVLELLRGAVWLERKCRVHYRRSDGLAKRYWLEPYALVAKVDTWYLVARTARRMRVFRLQRMLRVELGDATFERDAAFDLPTFWQTWCRRFEADPGNHYYVDLSLTPRGRALLLARYGEWFAAPLAQLDDSAAWSNLRFDFEQEHTALEAMQMLGREVGVVGPAAFRDRLRRCAEDMLVVLATEDA
jgi:predicted DNA-binding transcriptional regulator YafY